MRYSLCILLLREAILRSTAAASGVLITTYRQAGLTQAIGEFANFQQDIYPCHPVSH